MFLYLSILFLHKKNVDELNLKKKVSEHFKLKIALVLRTLNLRLKDVVLIKTRPSGQRCVRKALKRPKAWTELG